MISISTTPIQTDSDESSNELWDDTSKVAISEGSFRKMPMRDTSEDDWNDGVEQAEGFSEDMYNDPEHFDLFDIFTRY